MHRLWIAFAIVVIREVAGHVVEYLVEDDEVESVETDELEDDDC